MTSSDPKHDAEDVRAQSKLREDGNLPRHIAIIMDGDRRWAQENNLPVTEGHRHGREAAREAIRACSQLGIEVLTLYTFSTENWSRPDKEVSTLMRWLRESLRDETPELNNNKRPPQCHRTDLWTAQSRAVGGSCGPGSDRVEHGNAAQYRRQLRRSQ